VWCEREVWAEFYFAGYTNAHDKSMVRVERLMTLLGFGLDAVRQQIFRARVEGA
jgi:hypothetical protein